VAATLYFMITGDAPPEANERVERDGIRLPSQMMISLPQSVENGLLKGLAVKAGERFENIPQLQRAIAMEVNVAHEVKAVSDPHSGSTQKTPQAVSNHPQSDNIKWLLYLSIGGFILIMLLIYYGATKGVEPNPKSIVQSPAPASQTPPPAQQGSKQSQMPSRSLFQLEPFIVNIYDGLVLRYLRLIVELEITHPAVKYEIEGQIVPIRDSILILLSSKTLQDIQDSRGKKILKKEILGIFSKHINSGGILNIYFTDFTVQ